jgi:hypothetical protein
LVWFFGKYNHNKHILLNISPNNISSQRLFMYRKNNEAIMATRDMKQLNQGKGNLSKPGNYDLSVMKPFVKFGIGAMGAIAHTLIGIVKAIPKPHHDDDDKRKNNKIIKI